ncbi:MAG: flagellar basal-body MS-ring/collar protein FliF [Kiloniellales bacterium]
MSAFIETLRNLGPARLASMAAVAAAVIAFFIYLTSRLTSPDMALLYGDLDSQDSGQIVSRLEQQAVHYTLGPTGSEIYVPADQVARLRVAMAEDGLPSGGSIGYEIFDRSEGLGTTNFVQNINHLRALEGELARTIRSIGSVKQARVHLVLPRREVFSRERTEPSASIVVAMYGSRRLDRQQVLAIQHIVAAAVPGLKPKMISIVDDKGTLLARGAGDEDDPKVAASNAEEMRVAYESRLARTVEELLERSVGPGNVRAEVTAQMDFDRVTENSEVYDPEGQVVRSTQVVEETSNSQDDTGDDAVTVGNNLPDAGLNAGGGGSQSHAARTEETVNYEISRTVKTHVREGGQVRRLSVAVLVNGRTSLNENGETVYEPRSNEELEQLATLARSAVGYDESRGDTIEVVNMRFVDIAAELDAQAGSTFLGLSRTDLMRMLEIAVLGIIGILVVLLVVRPLIRRMLETQAGGGPGDQPADLLTDGTAQRRALTGPQTAGAGTALAGLPAEFDDGGKELEQMIDLNQVEGRVRASTIRKIGEIVEKHPQETVSILRGWLHQET